MEQIKIIEKNVKEILEQGKDFSELVDKFDNLLNNLYKDYVDLKEKRTKLLNILLKYPKRKILFEFDLKECSSYISHFQIGLNESGVGLSTGGSLRNIEDYWEKEKFEKLCKDKEFKKLFIENISEKHKDTIKKLIEYYAKDWKKEVKVGDIIIKINENCITFFNKECSYGYELDSIRDRKFKKRNKTDFLKEITDIDLDFDFEKLVKFSFLLRHKDKIMGILNKEILEYEKLSDEIKEKLSEVDIELKPYEALQKI